MDIQAVQQAMLKNAGMVGKADIQVHPEDELGNIVTLMKGIRGKWNGLNYRVPKGFESDGISTPSILWPVISPPVHPHTIRAGIVHDWLYRHQPKKWTREDADKLFEAMCEEDGLSPIKAKLAYTGLRLFGEKAWDENAARKLQEIEARKAARIAERLAAKAKEKESIEKAASTRDDAQISADVAARHMQHLINADRRSKGKPEVQYVDPTTYTGREITPEEKVYEETYSKWLADQYSNGSISGASIPTWEGFLEKRQNPWRSVPEDQYIHYDWTKPKGNTPTPYMKKHTEEPAPEPVGTKAPVDLFALFRRPGEATVKDPNRTPEQKAFDSRQRILQLMNEVSWYLDQISPSPQTLRQMQEENDYKNQIFQRLKVLPHN